MKWKTIKLNVKCKLKVVICIVKCKRMYDDNEVDRIVNVDWDGLETAQDNNIDVLIENCKNVAFSTHRSKMFQGNREENLFRNEHFVASTLMSHMILEDVDQKITKFSIQKRSYDRSLYACKEVNFKFRVKKLNKEIYKLFACIKIANKACKQLNSKIMITFKYANMNVNILVL